MLSGPIRRAAAGARALVRRFIRRPDGVSAVEFGLLAPVLAIMLGGAIELSGAITAANRATFVADAVAEMVSRVDRTMTDAELKNFAVASALIDTDIVRYARVSGKPIEEAFKITITSVQFEPKVVTCVQLSCEYRGFTVFSYGLNTKARPCRRFNSSASAGSGAYLPKDVFGPGSLVVVDVETFYAPVMPIRLDKTISFKRSSYFRPRYLPRVNSENNCEKYEDA